MVAALGGVGAGEGAWKKDDFGKWSNHLNLCTASVWPVYVYGCRVYMNTAQ